MRGRNKYIKLGSAVILIVIQFLVVYTSQAENPQYSFLRISTSDGLVNNQTNCIFKDSRGFIWFGTTSGLSRYDGTGFKNFSHNDEDSTSILDNYIENIQEDKDGNIWIKTRWFYTIYYFDKENFRDLSKVLPEMGINESVTSVYIDLFKNLWIKTAQNKHFLKYDYEQKRLIDPFENGTDLSLGLADFIHDGKNYYYLYSNGVIECYNGTSYKLIYRDKHLLNQLGSDSLTSRILVDKEGDLWIYGNSDGIHYYQTNKSSWYHYTTDSNEIRLSSNLISKIVQDTDGIIWIGTDHGGIDIYNKYTHANQTLYYQPENNKSISQNSITDLMVDDEGIVWVGTYKNGICYYHESIHKFPHYHHIVSKEESLPFNDVNCFVEDQKGNLWIGTNGGGLLYFDRENGTYTNYKYDPQNSNSLSNDVVVSLFIDNQGLLWIGTYTGGLVSFDGKAFERYAYSKSNTSGLTSNNIWAITQDKNGSIWIGTLGGGIVLFDKESQTFTPPQNYGDINLPTVYITFISKMRNGNMMIGTASGVMFYDIEKQQYKYRPFGDINKPIPISNNNVNAVFEDSRGLLWIATREGLTMVDLFNDIIKVFNRKDDLPQDIINCILEDDDRSIWVSKSTGLSQIQVFPSRDKKGYEFEVKNFTVEDGLQGKEFNVFASYKTEKGELIFGGPNGFNMFQPGNIKYNTNLPDVEFTDFQIFNRSIRVGEKIENRAILNKSIISTDSITLTHSMNVFSIEFAALSYFISDKIEYQYMLEGFDQNWIEADENVKKVTYTNLNAGEYIFKVKASNNDGFWNEDFSQLYIEILPPFYKTPLAYIFYLVMVITILLYYRYTMLNKERIKFQMEQERLQSRRHLEMDEIKLRFLTNVSHEFRTPLTLILTPLERLLRKPRPESDVKLLNIIERNAHQLLNLVNQLLDFRKLDLHGLKFNPSYGDIVTFVKDINEVFVESFHKKGIKVKFETKLTSYNFQFDHEKIQKVMMNLLSNALKFTPKGGKVNLNLDLIKNESGEEQVIIVVKDTGVGILKEEIDKIFERFYQSKNNLSLGLSGSGIGLNLVREMVLLHGGEISVKSEPGHGAEFTVVLPVNHVIDVEKMPKYEGVIPEVLPEAILTPEVENSELQTVLLVEDNVDFRSFMKETLEEKYKIIEAADGNEGYELACSQHPDLIISDVMMPKMDGLEMCKKLKNDLRTSHISIILLTARTADEDKIKGLEIGADDYITKPFNMDLLLLRIQNLVEKRHQSQKEFQKKMEITPSEIEISSIDEKLIKKAISTVEENISEPKFSVEDLSHELGMSRVYLYKKLMAITGKSPVEFIRIIRLKRGAQLLEKSQKTVSEVAYEVGFNTPRYFSKYFYEEFGELPSDYIKKFGVKTNQKID